MNTVKPSDANSVLDICILIHFYRILVVWWWFLDHPIIYRGRFTWTTHTSNKLHFVGHQPDRLKLIFAGLMFTSLVYSVLSMEHFAWCHTRAHIELIHALRFVRETMSGYVSGWRITVLDRLLCQISRIYVNAMFAVQKKNNQNRC